MQTSYILAEHLSQLHQQAVFTGTLVHVNWACYPNKLSLKSSLESYWGEPQQAPYWQ